MAKIPIFILQRKLQLRAPGSGTRPPTIGSLGQRPVATTQIAMTPSKRQAKAQKRKLAVLGRKSLPRSRMLKVRREPFKMHDGSEACRIGPFAKNASVAPFPFLFAEIETALFNHSRPAKTRIAKEGNPTFQNPSASSSSAATRTTTTPNSSS